MMKFLSSARITVACLFLLFILTFWGTIAQVHQGLYAAQGRFFNSFFFLAGGFIPFPGAQLVLWVLFVNLICSLALTFKKYTQLPNLGLLIIHFGLILYFVAAFMIFHFAQESSVRLAEGEETHISISNEPGARPIPLPFTIRLDHFKAEFHPGTDVAKSFESMVTITTGSLERQVRIYMNNPLRYKDYTVYQASYDTDSTGKQHSTLAVVKNFAKIIPYIACFIVFFGLGLHFLMQAFATKRSNLLIVALTLSLSFLGTTAFAKSAVHDFNNFKKIPVLDNGRLKPLDTYARNLLTQFSGQDHYGKQEASAWLASLFFDPDSTGNNKIFLINNPDIATALGITPQQDRRYTPNQLQQSYPMMLKIQQAAEKIPEKDRSLAGSEMIRVFGNVILYADLSHSFTFSFPLIQSKYSFIDIAIRASQLKTDDPDRPKILSTLSRWSQDYKDMPFTAIPINSPPLVGGAGGGGTWTSPWDALSTDLANEQTRRLLMLWDKMAVSYAKGDDAAFNKAARSYLNSVRYALSKDDLQKFHKFPLELFYQASSPFTWSIMFYILAFIFFVASFTSSKPLWYNLGLCSIIAGFIPHFLGLAMRIIIMARPPVSSLYETFVFVSLITVILGLLIEYHNRQWLGIVTAAISGTALLFIANKYSAEGDTLKVLVAVLNSNFWLATHVTTITMGYGATCVGGLLGHIWLLQAVFKKDAQTLDKTYKTTLGILGLALTLTFLGTNLGGIWADQSWGRFWGWDPKENGALMIVLWTAILFHAKAAQMISARGLAVGAVIGMMVVMWAWFGVNLLSVGLHSYGFTSGIATSLIIYAAFEITFLCVTTFLISKK